MHRFKTKTWFAALGLALIATVSGVLVAADAPAPTDPPMSRDQIPLSKKGADTCLKCHDEDFDYPVVSIFKTKHAQIADERTPFADTQCEACHGPGGEHTKLMMPGEKRPPMFSFGKDSGHTAQEQNAVCLQCHDNQQRIEWQGSFHASEGVACVQCHTVHAEKAPMLSADTQIAACVGCHKRLRAAMYKASAHPLRYEKIRCTDCHNVHGSARLKFPVVNETCYECHAEKRGPFLWEHAPVPENCTLCHNPHGSNHPTLLKKRAPLLCQQCHSVALHPAVALSGTSLPPRAANRLLLAKGCLNCHSQIHGSNHPSGVKLMR